MSGTREAAAPAVHLAPCHLALWPPHPLTPPRHLPPCAQDAEGNSKGCGIVTFASPHDALRAISLLSNSMLADRQVGGAQPAWPGPVWSGLV